MSSQNENEASPKGSSTGKLHQKMNDEKAKTDAIVLEHPIYIQLQKKLEEVEEKANQGWDRLLRQQAEMDNAQRRSERDVANAHKYALEKFIPELLPVVDSMERSQEISTEEHAVKNVLEGISLCLKMFYGVLEKVGVEQINPQGEIFNPELHQAVSVQEDKSIKPGTVLNVLQKGYSLNGRLIRPALVVVSK